MTDHLAQLISQYGYWLMLFGALIEGETFLIAGGIAASQGLLGIPGLIGLALVGSIIHDHFFFFLGRFAGHAILDRRPQWKDKASVILKHFDKYGVWLIIILRFMYGLRTVIPTVLGMSPISLKKFFIFDVIGGVIWSCCFVLGGYFFGHAITQLLKAAVSYEVLIFKIIVVLLILAIVAGIIYFLIKKRPR